MKHTSIYIFLIVVLLTGIGVACNRTTTTTTPSSDPTISSLTFASKDSFPGLAKAVFTIEERNDTGLIYNVDSLLYGTHIDSVVPAFRFKHTPASAVIYTPRDTITLTGKDTIDFTVRPMYIRVVAEDLVTTKWYAIEVNVHQVDPDLYVWEQTADKVYPTEGAEQKLTILNSRLYLFVNYGTYNKLYASAQGEEWTEQTLTGLPDNCDVRTIMQGKDELWYADGTSIYKSSDALTWSQTDLSAESFLLTNMLLCFNDSLWAIAQDKTTELYHLALSADGESWTLRDALPEDFPVSDYATTTFLSKSKRLRAMVMGGFSAKGESLNTRWNVEYLPGKGYKWLNFSIDQPKFQKLTGVAVIAYADRFFLFGGVDADNRIGSYAILESQDEGMNWYVPDSAHNMLPATYTLRTKPSVAIDEKQNIFIVGGQSRTEVFSDVYRGRLNSIDW